MAAVGVVLTVDHLVMGGIEEVKAQTRRLNAGAGGGVGLLS